MSNLTNSSSSMESSAAAELSTSPPISISTPVKKDAKLSSFSWFKLFEKNEIKDDEIFALDEEVGEKDPLPSKEPQKESSKTAKDSFKSWFGTTSQKDLSGMVLPSSPPNQSASLLQMSTSPRKKEEPKGALHVTFNTTFDEEMVSIVHNSNSEISILQSIQQKIHERTSGNTVDNQELPSKPDEPRKPVDLRSSNSDNLSTSAGNLFQPLSPGPSRHTKAKVTTPMIKELKIAATPPFDFVMTKMPAELFSVLTLQSLSLQRNEFATIPPNITQLQALQQLVLSHNHMKTLPDIKSMTSLTTLDVSSNQLQSFPSLQGMHLKQLLIHKNQLSSLPNLSDQLELEIFSASHNKLTTITVDLQKLSALRQLNLAHNTLTTFPDKKSKDFFQAMILLEQLQMQHNKLTSITPSIGYLVQLTECNFSHNQLTTLPKEMGSLVNLKKLDVSNNLLASLCEDLSQLKALESLLLKDNKLASLPSLKDLENLSELTVSNNMLSNAEHLANLPISLRSLDIAFNSFNALPQDLGRLSSLVRLDASHNNISSLSQLFGGNNTILRNSSSEGTNGEADNTNSQPAPGLLSLKHLHLSHNALQSIPAEIGTCQALVDLDISENPLNSLPIELRSLVLLETLSLQSKKSTFTLTGECLPPALNKLSFGNIQINKRKGEIQLIQSPDADATASPMTVQVPALLGCVKTIPHLLVMFALADCSMQQDLADILIEQDGLSIFWDLLGKLVSNSTQVVPAERAADILHCTTTLSNLYDRITSDNYRFKLGEAAKECPYNSSGVDLLIKQIQDKDVHLDTRVESIRCLGIMCHDVKCKNTLVEAYGIDLFTNMATNFQVGSSELGKRSSSKDFVMEELFRLQRAFNQFLNMIGAHDFLHFPPSANRTKGVRILTMDGGGTRALVTLEILKKIEQLTGRRITEMFDLIGGTSTGAVLATLVGIRGYPLDKCEALYKDLSHKVFAIGNAEKPSDVTGWSKFLNYTNMLKSGAFYKTKNFVDVISTNCGTEYLIDTTQDERIKRAKVFYCSTAVSILPPQPYLYRNYNYPVGCESRYSGSCRTRIFNGLRASTAAPFLFEEFEADGLRFQDGGIVANNPCALAIHEAKCLFKGRPIECVVSLGTGKPGIKPVKSKSLVTNVMNALIKSCTNVETVNNIMLDVLSETNIKYLRFSPIGPEFGVELDETDDEKLRQLQAAAREWVEKHVDQLMEMCELLKDPILP